MKILRKTERAFTLIEVLVVIGILGVLVSFGLVIDLNVFKRDTFQAEESTIVAILEKARSRAMANMFESPHGVCYIEPNYVIFKGATCSASGGELISANADIATLSNFSTTFPTILFDQLSGNSNNTTIHLTDGLKSKDIEINNEGRINW